MMCLTRENAMCFRFDLRAEERSGHYDTLKERRKKSTERKRERGKKNLLSLQTVALPRRVPGPTTSKDYAWRRIQGLGRQFFEKASDCLLAAVLASDGSRPILPCQYTELAVAPACPLLPCCHSCVFRCSYPGAAASMKQPPPTWRPKPPLYRRQQQPPTSLFVSTSDCAYDNGLL